MFLSIHLCLEFSLSKLAPKSIVIVGGGASATLLLAQLSIQLHSYLSTNIYIIDNSENFNLGVAYSVEHPSFILNVVANRMGAWCDKPDDFYQWLNNYPHLWRNLHKDFASVQYYEEDFVPRMIYGAYLRWIFECSIVMAKGKNIHVHRISAKVSTISDIKYSSKLLVKTDRHESFRADVVIVATGNSTQKNQNLIGKNIFPSPYHPGFITQNWADVNNIIIVGSGLSMVDAVQFLSQQHYKGDIQVFSRHGLIPLPHLKPDTQQECKPFIFSGKINARTIVKKIRSKIRQNSQLGINWQTTINKIRVHTNDLWLSLSTEEQKKLRRLLPWWNVARHRIPKTVFEYLIKLQLERKLTITKGDVKQAESDGEYFLLKLHQKTAFIKADKLVVCSGYFYDQQLKKICGNLFDREAIYCCHNQKLSKTHELYAIGPVLGGLLFETTAIHEIRQQSLDIAVAIVSQLQESLEAHSN